MKMMDGIGRGARCNETDKAKYKELNNQVYREYNAAVEQFLLEKCEDVEMY